MPIYYSGKLLENLINDMLDYSLILKEQFALDIMKFQLYEKTLEIFQFFTLQAKAKHIELIYEIDYELYK